LGQFGDLDPSQFDNQEDFMRALQEQFGSGSNGGSSTRNNGGSSTSRRRRNNGQDDQERPSRFNRNSGGGSSNRKSRSGRRGRNRGGRGGRGKKGKHSPVLFLLGDLAQLPVEASNAAICVGKGLSLLDAAGKVNSAGVSKFITTNFPVSPRRDEVVKWSDACAKLDASVQKWQQCVFTNAVQVCTLTCTPTPAPTTTPATPILRTADP